MSCVGGTPRDGGSGYLKMASDPQRDILTPRWRDNCTPTGIAPAIGTPTGTATTGRPINEIGCGENPEICPHRQFGATENECCLAK